LPTPDPTDRYARKVPVALAGELTPAELRVLVAVASHADAAGRCWPGLRVLGRELARSPSTVGDVVRDLIALGHLRVAGRLGQLRVLEVAYLAAVDNLASPRGRAPVDRADRPRATRGWSARCARMVRAEQDHEHDQEQEAPPAPLVDEATAPTPAGRAIAAALLADLSSRYGPNRAPAPVAPPSDVYRARQRRRQANAARRTAPAPHPRRATDVAAG